MTEDPALTFSKAKKWVAKGSSILSVREQSLTFAYYYYNVSQIVLNLKFSLRFSIAVIIVIANSGTCPL
jgi:hypothetical protein